MSSTFRVFLLPVSFLRLLVVSAYLQGMPRLRESVTRQVKSLSGLWDFRADPSTAGFDEMWYSRPLRSQVKMNLNQRLIFFKT